MSRKLSALLLSALFVLFTAGLALAHSGRFIDDNDTVVMRGNTHPLARHGSRAGLASTFRRLEHMVMSLQIPAEKRAALDKLLQDQHDPSSADYHRWLTPEEFGAKFGPDAEDVATVSQWLHSHGFQVEAVGKSRTWINFSGDVAHVERAFTTEIATVTVGGKLYHANTSDPSLPRGLANLVSGVVTLHNIPRQPKHHGAKAFASNQAVPNYTYGSSHYLAPGDFAAIYNVTPVYTSGIDGTGQSIAIAGRTHPSATNWANFRSTMALPANAPQVIVNGPDPGSLGADEDTEADLDVEWAGAVAKNATIKFVVSKSTYSTDGVDLSAQYIVNNNLAPVMSVSFGSCEADMGSTELAFYNNLWAQAAAQGITVLVAAGDSGAAGCSDPGSATGSGRAVNGLASTPYNVAVGGTQFSDASGTFWNSVNTTGGVSATGYIPEAVWNESGAVSGGTGLWATGGGSSQVYAKPSWQSAPGVPQDGRRDVPDVSLSGASHDAYLIYSGGYLSSVGGTSVGAPSFAGLMALVVQKHGARVGNPNLRLYQLATSQYGSAGAAVFHDVTAGNNSVPGVTGYSAVTGYDLATGLGSVDANALVGNWDASSTGGTTATTSNFSVTANSPQPIIQGNSGSIAVTSTISGTFNAAVSLAVSGLPSGVTASFAPASIAAPGNGTATLTFNVGAAAPAGTSTVTITATGGGATRTVLVSLAVKPSVIYSSSFSSDSWYATLLSGTARWSLVTYGTSPTALPHTGSAMAQYSAASGSQSRIYSGTTVALPSYAKSATFSFWMYHDPNRPTYNDRLQAQVSTNGYTWTNVGSAVSRYASTAGWSRVDLDLTSYLGRSLRFGFLGTSAGGYNMYLDDISFTVR